VKISGYAYAPAGKIGQILLVVDEYPLAAIPYGSARPDICAALSNVSACPNIGFDLDFDSTRLSNGPHFVSILVDDDRGNTGQFPASFFSGVNVTVENGTN
jgi:hypothetical protein